MADSYYYYAQNIDNGAELSAKTRRRAGVTACAMALSAGLTGDEVSDAARQLLEALGLKQPRYGSPTGRRDAVLAHLKANGECRIGDVEEALQFDPRSQLYSLVDQRLAIRTRPGHYRWVGCDTAGQTGQ